MLCGFVVFAPLIQVNAVVTRIILSPKSACIFKHLSLQTLQSSKMVERFVELLGDEESDVQSVSINCLVWVFQKLPAGQARAAVLPILSRILQTCQGPVMQTFLS